MIHISLAAETIFHIGPFPVTNTLLMSWLAIIVILVIAYFGTRKKQIIPRGFQNFFEALIEGILGIIESVTENRKQAIKLLPFIGTFILFITLSNWMGLLPGVGTIGFFEEHTKEEAHAEEVAQEPERTGLAESLSNDHDTTIEDSHDEPVEDSHAASKSESESEDEASHETPVGVTEEKNDHSDDSGHGEKTFVPLFRSTYSDINMTLALSLISVIGTQILGIAAIGFFKYGKKFINFSGVIPFFVGILELVGEVAHLISFSFRLFGNVFAGEVLLVVIAFLVAYAAPVPFYFLELFVGFIQALVFSLLTLVFIKTATAEHEAH